MATTRTLKSILIDVGDVMIDLQRSNGSIPGGNNGPHCDPETPVRNTSHGLILFTKLYNRTSLNRYYEAAERAAEYLMTDEARPHGATFHHRNSDTKDRCNGTIGQAWTIEAIAEAGRVLDYPQLIDTAEEVFRLHPFDDPLALWKRVEIDGDVMCFDSTLNHQQWFAAAGGLLATHHDVSTHVDTQVRRFLDTVDSNLELDAAGLYRIVVAPPIRRYPRIALTDDRARLLIVLAASKFPFTDSKRVRDAIRTYTPISRLPLTTADSREKTVGYHSFHLYGFALLKQCYPDHPLWEKPFLEKTLDRIDEPEFVSTLKGSRYGYPYNVSGIELAYSLEVFREDSRDAQERWLSRQFNHYWDPETSRMSRNNPDPATLTSRVYEASRLSDWDLQIEIN